MPSDRSRKGGETAGDDSAARGSAASFHQVPEKTLRRKHPAPVTQSTGACHGAGLGGGAEGVGLTEQTKIDRKVRTMLNCTCQGGASPEICQQILTRPPPCRSEREPRSLQWAVREVSRRTREGGPLPNPGVRTPYCQPGGAQRGDEAKETGQVRINNLSKLLNGIGNIHRPCTVGVACTVEVWMVAVASGRRQAVSILQDSRLNYNLIEISFLQSLNYMRTFAVCCRSSCGI